MTRHSYTKERRIAEALERSIWIDRLAEKDKRIADLEMVLQSKNKTIAKLEAELKRQRR